MLVTVSVERGGVSAAPVVFVSGSVAFLFPFAHGLDLRVVLFLSFRPQGFNQPARHGSSFGQPYLSPLAQIPCAPSGSLLVYLVGFGRHDLI